MVICNPRKVRKVKAIGSSNTYYNVYVRGIDSPIRMSEDGGVKLSMYLEGTPGMFIHIKDTNGDEHTIRVMTIDRVQKYQPSRSSYKTIDELNLPQLVEGDYQEREWK